MNNQICILEKNASGKIVKLIINLIKLTVGFSKSYINNMVLIIFLVMIIGDCFSQVNINKEKTFVQDNTKSLSTQIIPNKTELFTFNNPESVDITDEMKEYLDAVAEFLKANPTYKVIITGHSDNSGTFEERQLRSKMRAENVLKYLVRKGVPRVRIQVRFRGAIAPIATDDTPDGRKKNSRIEIVVKQ